VSSLQRHIVIVGLMGAGKTTVGQHLSHTLGSPWIDVDQKIVAEHKMSIAEMFKTAGDEVFREIEHHTLLDALEEPKPHVVSTGGGVVEREDNRELIEQLGWCVWLRAGIDVLYARVSGDADRPMLGSDPRGSLEVLHERREALYDALADLVLDVDDVAIDDIVSQILFAARGVGVVA
jgi:shikimate kinase